MADSFQLAMTTASDITVQKEKWCTKFIGGVSTLLCKKKPKVNFEQSFYRRVGDSLTPSSFNSTDSLNISKKNLSLRKMPSITTTLTRGSDGFGLTVKGSCPVRVGQVTSGGPAESAGLRVDDCISAINGMNVSRSSEGSVTKIVTKTVKILRVEVHRGRGKPLTSSLADDPRVSAECSGSQSGSKGLLVEEMCLQADGCVGSDGSSAEVRSLMWKGKTPPTPISTLTDNQKEIARDRAMADIVDCERKFVVQMHDGIQHFSEVMRTINQQTFLRDVKKLVAMSAYQVAKLWSADEVKRDLGGAYQGKVEGLCVAYQDYSKKLPAVTELVSTRPEQLRLPADETFHLDKAQKVVTFLNAPLQHMKSLLAKFKRVQLYTTAEHPDHMDITLVMSALEELCSHYIETTSTSLTSATKDNETLFDSEQISLANGVKPFSDATSDRHVIFSDEVMLVGGASCQMLQILLLDDMILLAAPNAHTGELRVVDVPIHLTDITAIDFNCGHKSDFKLCCQRTTNSVARHLTFRTVSRQKKGAWKIILDHQIQVAPGIMQGVVCLGRG